MCSIEGGIRLSGRIYVIFVFYHALNTINCYFVLLIVLSFVESDVVVD